MGSAANKSPIDLKTKFKELIDKGESFFLPMILANRLEAIIRITIDQIVLGQCAQILNILDPFIVCVHRKTRLANLDLKLGRWVPTPRTGDLFGGAIALYGGVNWRI